MMAKDQSSKSRARSSYEKISKVTFGFTRRVSHTPKNTNSKFSMSPSDPPTIKPLVSHTPSSALYRPPVSDKMSQKPKNESFYPPEVKPAKKFVRFLSGTTKKSGDGGVKELSSQKTFSEDNYSRYIDNTKMKMRSPSNVTSERTVSRRESFNDMFSGYINRTKQRLRTSSTVGTSK